ncbi:MAG: HAD family hydrolase [Phycisphaeraceae bacterium]
MRFDAALFDLDGTLLDTLTDLSASANHALRSVGRPTHPRDAYRTLVGQGVRQLFIDALGPGHRDLLDDAVAAFHAHYADHRFDTTAPYAGIDAMLDRLVDARIKLGVLSNKPHEATVDVVSRCFGRLAWDAVRGHMPGTQPKPDPTSAIEVLQRLGVAPTRCVYVGDTKVDMLTGKAAGMHTVGVSWGFRSVHELKANGADAIIDEPGQLLEAIAG